MIWAALFVLHLIAVASAYPTQDDDTAVIPEFTPERGVPVDAPATTKQLVFIKFSGTLYPETLKDLHDLEAVVFQDSKIDDIQSGALCAASNLKRVTLNLVEMDELKATHFEGCRNLRRLEIRYRDFRVAPNAFQKLQKLETLETAQFRWGELKKEHFTGLDSIREISITSGEVASIEPGTFEELETLEKLVLANNKLPSTSGDEFRGLRDLKMLSVDANPLTSFDIDGVIRNLPKLRTLFVSYALLPEEDWEYVQKKAEDAGIAVNRYE